MIGGTVYNHFPSNYEKQKRVDRDYQVLNLEISKEKDVRKYPQATVEIIAEAKKINESGRRFVVYAVCESFMEAVISEGKDINMYVVNHNSEQDPVFFTEFDPEIREKS